MTAVAVAGFTSFRGVKNDRINAHIKAKWPVQKFFQGQVLADLKNPNANPVLKVGRNKYGLILCVDK